MKLTNKIILLISPQAWGNMHLAKHHYAIELAKHNNEVYFLNPPQQKYIKNSVEILASGVQDKLLLINHSLLFPYQIKFKWIRLFHFLMKFHIKKIEKSIGKKIDIVWNFDLGYYYPFKLFNKGAYKLFFPIDEPVNKAAIKSAQGADIIFSITTEILEKYRDFDVPKHFMHHGLSEEFINVPNFNVVKDNTIRIGLSGNWLRTDIDTQCLLQIINENPTIFFEFWGSYQAKQSNIGGGNDKEVAQFIASLQKSKNVVLHGTVSPKELSVQFQRMDGFLICYDILKDQSKGTNYHKVMEYLSTGKVIISNNITTYSSMPNLLEMTESRMDNEELPQLFKTVVSNLKHYNKRDFVAARKEFALGNLYSKKVEELNQIISDIR